VLSLHLVAGLLRDWVSSVISNMTVFTRQMSLILQICPNSCNCLLIVSTIVNCLCHLWCFAVIAAGVFVVLMLLCPDEGSSSDACQYEQMQILGIRHPLPPTTTSDTESSVAPGWLLVVTQPSVLYMLYWMCVTWYYIVWTVIQGINSCVLRLPIHQYYSRAYTGFKV